MVLLGGAELLVLKPLITKYVAHHAITGAATVLAHAPAHAVAISAHTVACNVLAAAAGAGTAVGTVKILFAGGKTAKKIIKRAHKIKCKADLEHAIKSKSSDLDGAEKQELLIALITLSILESYYASLQRPTYRSESPTGGSEWLSPQGSTRYKSELKDMEPCGTEYCNCKDYVYGRPSDRDTYAYITGGFRQQYCKCNHRYGAHNRISEDDLDRASSSSWIMWEIAKEMYPEFNHRDATGRYKTELNQIQTCSRCPCPDFDWEPGAGFISQYCKCEHRSGAHVFFKSCDWIVGSMVTEVLEMMGQRVKERKTRAKKKKMKKEKSSSSDESADDSSDNSSDDGSDGDSELDDSDLDDMDEHLLDIFDDSSDDDNSDDDTDDGPAHSSDDDISI